MMALKTSSMLAEEVRDFVRSGLTLHLGQPAESFSTRPIWAALRQLGTELWLDTGDLQEAQELWTKEFTALTTNNTLLNKEVQKGQYDGLIAEANALLEPHNLSPQQRMLEIAFVLNARHGLRLVEKFDAFVAVEEHTDLAGDVEAAVEYGLRYHAICPERFIIKVPFTPAGLLAARRLAGEGIPVNHTLGFSARQNFVMTRIAKPEYVNVFLGRLNSFVAGNDLGDGACIGERATLASQAVVRAERLGNYAPTRQIGASFRAGEQVRDLAGIDVMTIPPKVAGEFLDLKIVPRDLLSRTGMDYQPALRKGVDPKAIRLETLWNVDERLGQCIEALEAEHLEKLTPDDLVAFFADHGCGDFLVAWTPEQVAASYAEGKIPKLANWGQALASGSIGLDALMNLAGLNSFIVDQKAMDDRVRAVLAKGGA